jgi:hypothetical protein
MSLLLSAKFEPRSASNWRAQMLLASGEEAGWHSGFCRATSLYIYHLLVISIVTGKESNGLMAMVTWWEIPNLATINLDINIHHAISFALKQIMCTAAVNVHGYQTCLASDLI